MKFQIACNLNGYLRLKLGRYTLDEEKSYSLSHEINKYSGVYKVSANHITGSVLIEHDTDVNSLIENLKKIDLDSLEVVPSYERDESTAIGVKFRQKLLNKFLIRFVARNLIPSPIGKIVIIKRALGYMGKGFNSLSKGEVNVDVLDGSVIGLSLLKGHYANAASIMFLLGISDVLEEYTREKSRNTLSSALIFQVDKVWIKGEDGEQYQKSLVDVQPEEQIIVRTGSMIPVDGCIVSGESEVNEASMTGESMPVQKTVGDSVFAGTVVVDGEILVSVRSLHSESRIQSILTMVEESEELKSAISSKAAHLADRIVPYSFLFSAIVFALTRSSEKALSALTVDYSCAIKLATPLSVISAISEASNNRIMVKGGKYLETLSEADTIVFDKTGTLTMATPKVVKVIPFGNFTRDEALRLAACLEEHFPHSLARAIVKKAEEENLKHKEEHAEVQYIVSHGVHSTWRGHKVLIGSSHFLTDDNGVFISEDEENIINSEGAGYSCVYLSVDNRLAGVICVQDPPRPEAQRIIAELKSLGIDNIYMLTGDSSQAAEKIAEELNIDNVFSGVLPEDKAEKIEELQSKGHRVIMVGDGINDTPALAKADVSISLRDATDLAREVSDITLLDSNLHSLIELIKLSRGMTNRIESNFTKIFTINTMLLVLGAFGTLRPTSTALLHNISTALIGASSTRNILPLN